MTRSLECVHCGTVLAVETRADRPATGLLAHLQRLHGELLGFQRVPRWAELLEHFRVIPSAISSDTF